MEATGRRRRRAPRHAWEPGGDDTDIAFGMSPDPVRVLRCCYEGDRLDGALLTALRRLPVRQREVIVLRVFLDLDIDTTARHLGIAPGTVRAHLSRGMAALSGQLAPATITEVER